MTHPCDGIISTTSGLRGRTSGFDIFGPLNFFTDSSGVLGFSVSLVVLEIIGF